MKALLRLVLFLDAAVALCVGLVLLASPMTSIFGALQLPQPEPAMYGQLLGVTLIGVAWLLWHATVNGQLTTAVAQVVGHVNLAVAVLVIAWLLFFHLPVVFNGQWSWRIEARIIACIMVFWLVEDFLWFVLNPAYGIAKFTPANVPWHIHWTAFAPTDYWTMSAAAIVLFFLSRSRTVTR